MSLSGHPSWECVFCKFDGRLFESAWLIVVEAPEDRLGLAVVVLESFHGNLDALETETAVRNSSVARLVLVGSVMLYFFT